MNCYEAIDLLGDDLEGTLAQERRQGFDEHMEECAACRTYRDQLEITIQAIEMLPRPPLTPERRSDLIAAFRRERTSKR